MSVSMGTNGAASLCAFSQTAKKQHPNSAFLREYLRFADYFDVFASLKTVELRRACVGRARKEAGDAETRQIDVEAAVGYGDGAVPARRAG